MLTSYLNSILPVVQSAGELLKTSFGQLQPGQIHEKGPRDVVTDLDKTIEKKYVEYLKKTFPLHGIIGEEGTEEYKEREYVWVIDPLDGTKNYVNGVPYFCTMLCLLRNQKPVLGVIYEPMTGHLYTAIQGQGAYCDGNKIKVSAIDALKDSTLLYCHGRKNKDIDEAFRYIPLLKKKCYDVTRLRSAGCEMAMVASGRAEAYVMNALSLWDLAAGALLVREAGGRATDFDGQEWKPSDDHIVVSNGTGIHQEIIDLITPACHSREHVGNPGNPELFLPIKGG